MRRPAHILPLLAVVMLVLVAAQPAAAGPTAPPTPPRDADPTLTDQHIVGEGAHEAGLVIDDGEEVRTFCVRFDEDEIDGAEILERTGADLDVAHFGTLGGAVCAIDGVGCPEGDCFCAAAYWSYWQGADEDGWTSSPTGPSSRTVHDGERDALVWGDGQRPPPPFALDEICDEENATAVDDTTRGSEDEDRPGTGSGELRGLIWLGLTLLAVLGAVLWVRRERDG